MQIRDCIDAMNTLIQHADQVLNTYNLGTRTTRSVNRIADIVSGELGCAPQYEYTGGERGWTGDDPKNRLSVEKLSALAWEPILESDEAVRKATRELIDELC